jgi:hypothetical protein
MSKTTRTEKKPIEQYDHKGKERCNNPPVGLVTPETDREGAKKTYAYDPHLDPTCGSGTTAYVAEQWGRRWITCDTSRVAVALAKQRLMTVAFDYYELAHPDEGVGSGFKYKTVPHITLKSIANNEPPGQETLYDQPFIDNGKARVSGPFTVEAVPAPVVKPLSEIKAQAQPADVSVARSGGDLAAERMARRVVEMRYKGEERAIQTGFPNSLKKSKASDT